jgi:transcriptional regulator with XRE-family HTH domain
MRITIGNNIKRLRTEKHITQEQLAEAMNVSCAAVSKWERSETYPEITVLQPLAFYFGVSLDELMGYDKEKVNEEIERLLDEFSECRRKDWEKAKELIKSIYKDYPNDYRVMYCYMWSLGVEDAEPDLDIALARKDEIAPICDRILEGCNDIQLCLGAWKMKAILLHAEGKTDEALRIHSEKFGDWYFSTGQMNEQLFKKDRPEFLYWAKRNMYELVSFAADKYVKSLFFDEGIAYEKMVSDVEKCADALYSRGCELSESYLVLQANKIFGRLHNDLIARRYRGGKDEDIIRIVDKYLSTVAKIDDMAKKDEALYDVCVKRFNTHDLTSYVVNSTLAWKNPNNLKMLENEEYRGVIEKYK